MPRSIICEGKTSTEAIEKGLKELKISKDKVDIKILEEEQKRSFFSILAPRIVKVELTIKGKYDADIENSHEKREIVQASKEEINLAKKNIDVFMKDFVKNLNNMTYSIEITQEDIINVDIKGEEESKLIGYRGDVLNSLQIIINSIACKNCENKVKVTLNVGNYKEKREKTLEELADKVSKTVIRTGKSITLESMSAYERRIIHNRLQTNKSVRTYSIGEEPYRKIVIAKN